MKIELDNVEKYYGDFRALGPLSLKIENEGITTILGPNGAGKTTMLKVLTGLSHPKHGDVRINDKNFRDSRKEILMDMGVLVEQPEFYPYLSGKEILEFSGKLKGYHGNDLILEIKRVAELTGSSSFLDKKVGKYSRGMKQRLGLASAMIGDPSILILDEPTFGIDPMGTLEIRDVLKDLNSKKDKIIIFTTHIIEEAMYLSDRIIILNNGVVNKDIVNDDKTIILKITGKVKDKSIMDKYGIRMNSDFEYTVEINKDMLPEFNREITKENEILFIERSSKVEEAIREVSSKNNS